jgi:predicted transcriptional regulator
MVMQKSKYDIAHNITVPSIRRAAARRMWLQMRMKQRDIASLLNVTQASVSKYMHSSKKSVKIDQKQIDYYVSALLENNSSKTAHDVMCEICQNKNGFECAFIVKKVSK